MTVTLSSDFWKIMLKYFGLQSQTNNKLNCKIIFFQGKITSLITFCSVYSGRDVYPTLRYKKLYQLVPYALMNTMVNGNTQSEAFPNSNNAIKWNISLIEKKKHILMQR